jgi:hypothetical protein
MHRTNRSRGWYVRATLCGLSPEFCNIAFAGVTFRLSLAANTSQLRWIEKVQQRLRVTSHFLDDVKVVKMLGFSGVMSTVIQKLRMEEIQTSRAYRKLFAAIILLCKSIPSRYLHMLYL